MTRSRGATPVRRALRQHSSLRTAVEDGLGAVKASDRDCFEVSIRDAFADSLDIDAGLKLGNDRQNRWDYLLGHRAGAQVIAVEPHPAEKGEIKAVIRKRKAAIEQLTQHLRPGAKVAKWLWVASGKVRFLNLEKAKLELDQNGIEFVGSKVLPKHLPGAGNRPSRDAKRRRG